MLQNDTTFVQYAGNLVESFCFFRENLLTMLILTECMYYNLVGNKGFTSDREIIVKAGATEPLTATQKQETMNQGDHVQKDRDLADPIAPMVIVPNHNIATSVQSLVL